MQKVGEEDDIVTTTTHSPSHTSPLSSLLSPLSLLSSFLRSFSPDPVHRGVEKLSWSDRSMSIGSGTISILSLISPRLLASHQARFSGVRFVAAPRRI